MKNKSIVIVCGDPKSTFNEILIKTLNNKVLKNIKVPIIIVGSKNLLENEFKKLKIKVNLQKFEDKIDLSKKNVYIIDIPLNQKKISLSNKNKYITKSFEIGLNLLKNKKSFALINGPISKTTFLKGKI